MSRGLNDTLDRVLALNDAHATETSPLTRAALDALWRQAFMANAIETEGAGEANEAVACEAFLIALDQNAAYTSDNFVWFRSRYDRFVYVDRIVTAPAVRGRGLARSLYEQLFNRAHAAGHDLVGCEVNLNPANPASDAFHAAFGFREVGRAQFANKTVRYLLLRM